jgi:hypothetical protein
VQLDRLIENTCNGHHTPHSLRVGNATRWTAKGRTGKGTKLLRGC